MAVLATQTKLEAVRALLDIIATDLGEGSAGVQLVDKDGTNKAIITENGELKVAVTGDFTLGDVSIDNVHIVDKDGNEIQLDTDGAMTVTTEDGKNVALGSTTDADTANTVVGLVKKLKALATSLDNKDFATETTQATLATEAKLETVRVLLNTISGIDFATETTLSAIKDTDGIKKITDDVNTATVDGNNVALGSTSDTDTETTVIGRLQKIVSDIATLNGKDFATQTTLSALKTLFDDGTALAKSVQPDTMSATTTSVTTTAASIVSTDSSRLSVTLQNMSNDTEVKIGQASDQCNFTLLPQSAITLDYTGVLYAVVDSGSATVQILDLS
jgi:hypothetical protein